MRPKKGDVINARCTLVGEKGHPPVPHTLWHMTRNGTSLVTTSWTSTHLTLTPTPSLSLPLLPPLFFSLSHSALCTPLLSLHTLTHTIFVVVWVLVCFSSRCGFICAGLGPYGDGAGSKQCADTTLRRLNEELGVGEAEDTVKEHTQRRCCFAVRIHNSSKRHPPYIIQPTSMSQLLSPLPPVSSHGSTR